MYASLQDNLRRQQRVGDRSWGTEAGMAHILNAPADSPPMPHEVAQVVASERRRERYHDCRREPMPENVATPHPEGALHARHALSVIQRNVGDRNWQLLTAAAIGTDYEEIARTTHTRAGALRTKVLRLRRELRALVA
jgi:hypothetical protein